MADANEIEVNGVKLSLSEIQLFTHERIETLTKQLEYFKKVEAVFDLLKIKKDCDLKDLSKYDQWWTSAFVKGLVDKEPICIKQEIASLTKVDYLGMKIFVSNNVKVKNSKHLLLAGSYNAIVYADQIVKSRFIPNAEGAFEGLYSSLHVYDAKVIKPAELVVLEAKEG